MKVTTTVRSSGNRGSFYQEDLIVNIHFYVLL